MGFIKLFSRLLTAWVAFLHPCFASYKALSHRPVSEPELERWVKYWAVFGAVVGVEYAAEWLVSWVPFYWEIKTVFVLYLALPQTQGSTYIYDNYLAPYFSRNEAQIDRDIQVAQTSVLQFVQERLIALWNVLWNVIRQAQASQPQGQAQGQGEAGAAPPAGSPAAVIGNLWRAYAPAVVSGIVRAQAGAPQPPAAPSAPQSQAASPAVTPGVQPQPRTPFTAAE